MCLHLVYLRFKKNAYRDLLALNIMETYAKNVFVGHVCGSYIYTYIIQYISIHILFNIYLYIYYSNDIYGIHIQIKVQGL